MSLLDDVSIVVTPNGYKAGTLYGVLPTATEGSDLVTNGGFDTDSDWNGSGSNGWTISGGKASNDGTSGSNNLSQSGILEVDKRYKIDITVSNYVSGNVEVSAGASPRGTMTANGTYTFYQTCTPSTTFYIIANSFDGSVDNVSVKEWTASDMDVTRATAATRVNEQGLIEEVPYNLLQQSNTFNTTWTLSSSIDLTSGQSGVGGSTDAWLLKRNSTGSRYIAQALSLSSDQYSFSVYLKAESTNWAYIWSYDGTTQNNAYFDLQNGVVGNTSGANFDGTKIESVGDGWYRCTLIYTQATTIVRIYPAYSNGSISIGTDNGIYIQYSQLEVGSTSKTYLPTTTRFNVPRIDYTGGGCPHILAEPQRTNLITYSEDFTDSSWTNAGVTVTPNNATSPDGTLNASSIELTSGDFMYFTHNTTINVGDTYTWSCFVKSSSLKINWGGGTPAGTDINTVEALSNGWYRQVLQRTFTATGTGMQAMFAEAVAGAGLFDVWGASLEEGYATSYIPTSGSTVTRNQDVFTRDGIGSLINDSEGVLFVEAKTTYDSSTSRRISLSDGSINNRVMLEFDETTENTIKAVITTGGVNSAIMTFAASDLSQYNKIAIKYKLNDFSIWFNGTEVVTDSSGGVPTGLTQLVLDGGDGSNFFYGEVKQLQVYDTALTDMQLIQLTGTSGTDFYESYSEMAESLTYTIQ